MAHETSSRHKSQQMSARESSSVASSTSARRRRENRLLSLGTLIITHANESVNSTSTTVANVYVTCESRKEMIRRELEETTDPAHRWDVIGFCDYPA